MVQVTFAPAFLAILAAVASVAVSSVEAHPQLSERATYLECTTALSGYLGFGSISSKGVIRKARQNVALSNGTTLISSVTGGTSRFLQTYDSENYEVAGAAFEWANCTQTLKSSGWSLPLPYDFKDVFDSTGRRFEYGWGILRPAGAKVHCMSLQTAPARSAFTDNFLLSTRCAQTTHASRIFFAARQSNNASAAVFMAPMPITRAGTTAYGSAKISDDSGGSILVSTAQTARPRYLTLTPEPIGCS